MSLHSFVVIISVLVSTEASMKNRYQYIENKAIGTSKTPLNTTMVSSRLDCAKLLLSNHCQLATFTEGGTCRMYEKSEGEDTLVDQPGTGYFRPRKIHVCGLPHFVNLL